MAMAMTTTSRLGGSRSAMARLRWLGASVGGSRRLAHALAASEALEAAPEAVQMNMFTAINDAMRVAMETDPTAVVFGEDVAFGGVFRCSVDLKEQFGPERVFNSPLCEQVRHRSLSTCNGGARGVTNHDVLDGGRALPALPLATRRRAARRSRRSSSPTTSSQHLTRCSIDLDANLSCGQTCPSNDAMARFRSSMKRQSSVTARAASSTAAN